MKVVVVAIVLGVGLAGRAETSALDSQIDGLKESLKGRAVVEIVLGAVLMGLLLAVNTLMEEIREDKIIEMPDVSEMGAGS